MDSPTSSEDLSAVFALIQSGKSAPLLDRHLDLLLRWLAGSSTESVVETYVQQQKINRLDFRAQLIKLLDQRLFAAGDSPYAILGVSSTSSKQEIKRRYYRLLKVFHPDHKQDDLARWTERTERLNRAYAALKRRNVAGDASSPNSVGVGIKTYKCDISYSATCASHSTWIRHVLGRSRQFTLRFFTIAIVFSIGLLLYIYAHNAPVEQPSAYPPPALPQSAYKFPPSSGKAAAPNPFELLQPELDTPPSTQSLSLPKAAHSNAQHAAIHASRSGEGFASFEPEISVSPIDIGTRSDLDDRISVAGTDVGQLSIPDGPLTASVKASTPDTKPTAIYPDLSILEPQQLTNNAELRIPILRMTPDRSILSMGAAEHVSGVISPSSTAAPSGVGRITATEQAVQANKSRFTATTASKNEQVASKPPEIHQFRREVAEVGGRISIQPVIQLEEIFSQFEFWYEQGNAEQLVKLFMEDAVDGEDIGRNDIQRAYESLFHKTQTRALEFEIVRIKPVDEESFLIDAQYKLTVHYRDGRSKSLDEKAKVWVTGANTNYKLKRVLYVK